MMSHNVRLLALSTSVSSAVRVMNACILQLLSMDKVNVGPVHVGSLQGEA